MQPFSGQQSLSLFKYQISGKAPKLASSDNRTILKGYIQAEQEFYTHFRDRVHISEPAHSLDRFLPTFLGSITFEEKPQIHHETPSNSDLSIWLQHVDLRYEKKNEGHTFIRLENFLYKYPLPNILDIKVGGRQDKPHKITKLVESQKLKLNGMLKTSSDGASQEFISKYALNSVTNGQHIQQHLAYFFTCGSLMRPQLSSICEQLKDLALAVRCMGRWKVSSTSVCLIYDSGGGPCRAGVKYIDFGRAKQVLEDNNNQDVVCGLQNLVRMLNVILENGQLYSNITITRNAEVIPKQKILKFGTPQKPKNRIPTL